MFAVMCGTRGNAMATDVAKRIRSVCSATSVIGKNGLCCVSPTDTMS